MPTKNLTDAHVRAIKHADGEIIDAKTGLIVRAAGAIVFSFRYRSGVTRRRISLGRYPTLSLADARAAAGRVREAVRNGEDPQQQRRDRREAGQALTFDELCDRYLEQYAKKQKASWRDDEGFLRNARRAWARRDAAAIAKQDVAKLLFEIAARAPVLANRLRSVLLKMYNWANDAALLDVNPVLGTRKPHRESQGKSRILNDAEIRTLWRAFDETTRAAPATVAALKCLLLTGQRPGEVSGMAVDELHHLDDVSAAIWSIPAHRMKARRAHAVPILPWAKQIITTELTRQVKPEFVFASKYTGRTRLARNSLSEALARIIDELDGDTAAVANLKSNPVTPHDLRRVAATTLSKLGVPREDRLSLMAHRHGDVHEQHYDHFDRLPQKRAALLAWEHYLRRVIGDPTVYETNIVSLRAAVPQ